jgi:hypothetical protein
MNDMYLLYAARSEEHRDAASILTRILSSDTSGTFTSLRISIDWSNYDYLISERVTGLKKGITHSYDRRRTHSRWDRHLGELQIHCLSRK